MWTLLFDIDGTLLRTGGAGWIAIERAMNELFGVQQVPKVPVGGRTDKGIFKDIFLAAEVPFSVDSYDQFRARYHQYLPNTMHDTGASLLPGVKELLEKLSGRPDVSLGLLTGNSKSAATTKVDHFGLGDHFGFGGFGDRHEHRGDVAADAVTNAREIVGTFDASKIWVIGDTVHDITCARSVGAKVVAVTTGGGSKEELDALNPELLLDDLADPQQFIDQVLG